MNREKFVTTLGLAGMLIIHSAAIPGIASALSGGNVPPVAMILQTLLALSLLAIHAHITNARFYFWGNVAGASGQIILLFAVLWK